MTPRALPAIVGAIAIVAGAVLAATAAASHRQDDVTVGVDGPATAMDEARGPASNSPALAVDPTEARFVVMANRLDAPEFGCALHVSGDSGRRWVPAVPVPTLPDGVERCYGPEVAFDGKGRLLYLFVGLVGTGNEPIGAYLVTSSDRARTFSAPRQVLDPSNFAVRMAVDPSIGAEGRIHLVWLHASSDPPLGGFGPPPNPILAAHSDDGGATFSEPVQVSAPGRRRAVAPALSIGPTGVLHVAYYDLGDDARDYQGLEGPAWDATWSLVVTTSTDHGRHFDQGVEVDPGVVPSQRVMLVFTMPPPALAAGRDKLCVAWTDARHGDDDALARCSWDRGHTWSSSRRLNDDPVGNGHRQYLPRLSISPDGRLDAVFLDRRDDPDNASNNTYFTTSDDGRHFARNRRLSTQSSSARFGQRYVGPAAAGLVDPGARLGLLSRDDGALAAWPDSRNAVDSPGTAQDVFVARVDWPPRWSLSWPSVALAVLLFAGGGALVAHGRRRRPEPLHPEAPPG